MTSKRLGMVIDIKRCIGCHTCAMACKMENNLPAKNWWNQVLTDGGEDMDTPKGKIPHCAMSYYTLACQHCSKPACVEVCPVDATYARTEDGVVIQDYDKCIGCLACVDACPYSGVRKYNLGVRQFNSEEPAYVVDFPLGDAHVTKHKMNTVEKCTFCVHRLENGLQPACIEICPGRARFFGDLNDPNSVVSQLIKKRSYMQLEPQQKTAPSIYFLT